MGNERNVQGQSSSVISTNLTVHLSSTSTPVTGTSSSSASMQISETQLVAYVENNTVQALGVPLESRKVIHGKPIPEGYISVQVSQTSGPSIPAPIILGNEDENSFLQTNMFFALPISRLFRYLYLKNTNSVKLSPYAVGT